MEQHTGVSIWLGTGGREEFVNIINLALSKTKLAAKCRTANLGQSDTDTIEDDGLQ